jgi:hypothetical protein
MTFTALTSTTLRQDFPAFAGVEYIFELDARGLSATNTLFNIGFGNSFGAAINVGSPVDVSASTSWGMAYKASFTAVSTQTLLATIDNRANTQLSDLYLSRLHLYPSSAKSDYVRTTNLVGGELAQVQLYLKQDSTGSRTVAWGPRVFWENSATPTLSTTAGTVDAVALTSTDGGATWRATLNGKGWDR